MLTKFASLPPLLALAAAALLVPGCSSSSRSAARARHGGADQAAAEGAGRLVTVKLKLPKGWQKTYAPKRSAEERQERCPASQVSGMLGVTFSSAHGCVIGAVAPKGNAAKAGLKVGDGIKKCNGGEVTCPSTLDPLLWISRGDTAELVVMRPPGPAAAAGKTEKAAGVAAK